ncbi:MAG: hybrid sensor histidine kinase/response regulator, partial [Microcoleaceae cyanobacterium]
VVGIATDGERALQKVAETQPDLVIMDIVIPGELDGIETADLVRAHFKIPVIYLTAYADSATLERAKVTAPYGYVLKPFQPQELNTAIQIALVRHHTELYRLNQLRRSISSSLPHEINTPLHGIIGFTNFIQKNYDSLSSTEILEMLQDIQNSAIWLEQTCKNFLLHAKLAILATEDQEIQKLRMELTHTVKFLIEYWAKQKAEGFDRTNDLVFEIQDCTIQISENYLQKILEEVLDNAFKFSKLGTPVLVQGFSEEQLFKLLIRDRGQGISLEQIAELGAYVQFGRKHYEQKGVGLGLIISQQLIHLHGGELTIESIPGEGTTVMIQFPIASCESITETFDSEPSDAVEPCNATLPPKSPKVGGL